MPRTANKQDKTEPAAGPATTRHLDILSGRAVVTGTCVPIGVVFDNLADGLTVDEIVESYPTLSRAAVLAVLTEAGKRMTRR